MERGTEEKASGRKEEMRGEGRGRREEGERGGREETEHIWKRLNAT